VERVAGGVVVAGQPNHKIWRRKQEKGICTCRARGTDDRMAAVQRIMDRHEPIDPAERDRLRRSYVS
jgi:hypothetical protein